MQGKRVTTSREGRGDSREKRREQKGATSRVKGATL